MTVGEVMTRIRDIDLLIHLREQGDIREGNIDQMIELMKEYRAMLLERKVVE